VIEIFNRYGDDFVKCLNCHKKVKPLINKNRLKMDFIGARYSGKDKAYWMICPICKFVIGTK
jgi:hypothetical protein